MKHKPSSYKLIINGLEVDLDIPTDLIVSVPDLVDNLADQPSMLAFYGQMKADVLHEKLLLEDKLDLVIASSRSSIRETVAQENITRAKERRLTKDELDDRVSLLSDVLEGKRLLRDCEYMLDRVTAAYNAVKERGMVLTSITQVYRAELNINDRLLEDKARSVRNRT